MRKSISECYLLDDGVKGRELYTVRKSFFAKKFCSRNVTVAKVSVRHLKPLTCFFSHIIVCNVCHIRSGISPENFKRFYSFKFGRKCETLGYERIRDEIEVFVSMFFNRFLTIVKKTFFSKNLSVSDNW